jgi:hypothetical protein
MGRRFAKLPVIAVVSQQRSGTNVFRQMLGSGRDTFDLGEIFKGDSRLRTNFWGFIANNASTQPNIVCPHYWYDAWEEYLDEQYERIGHKIFVIDLKIDYFRYILAHHSSKDFPPTWYFFFDISNFKFIYLERRNVAAQVVSRMRAEKTGEWSVLAKDAPREQIERLFYVKYPPSEKITPEDIPDSLLRVENRTKITIDPYALEVQIRNMILSNEFGLSFIERYNPLKLYYEDLFDSDGSFDADIIGEISRYSSLVVETLSTKPSLNRQIEHSFLDEIENKDEIVQHFRTTPFESMFR